jgi:hypothetical protein
MQDSTKINLAGLSDTPKVIEELPKEAQDGSLFLAARLFDGEPRRAV